MLAVYLLLGLMGLVLLYFAVVGVRLYIIGRKSDETGVLLDKQTPRILEMLSIVSFQMSDENDAASKEKKEEIFNQIEKDFHKDSLLIDKNLEEVTIDLQNVWKIWIKLH